MRDLPWPDVLRWRRLCNLIRFLRGWPVHVLGRTERIRDESALNCKADGAFSLGNSFGYYDDTGNEAFVAAVARALKPGARFLLDTSYLVEGLLPVLQERAW